MAGRYANHPERIERLELNRIGEKNLLIQIRGFRKVAGLMQTSGALQENFVHDYFRNATVKPGTGAPVSKRKVHSIRSTKVSPACRAHSRK